jgi:hypothetical protein
MDSTCLKDSNDILFAIFWFTDQKLWILQDLNKIWFQILVWNLFKPEDATCRYPIRGYHFGRIKHLSRWIKRKEYGPDLTVPVG